jgi:two-component system invasion response regulator UvrY
MIRVLIADDHPIFRNGLAGLIADTDDLQAVALVEDGLKALRVADEVAWDVALLDVSMPKLGGIEVMRRLIKAYPDRKVVMLSQFPENQFAARVEREGAAGYVSKSAPPEQLLDAIRDAVSGKRTPAGAVPRASAALHESLTPREYQVFTLVASGRGVTEVAAELNLAASTVSNHLFHIKDKLGVSTVGEIVIYAHRAGLAE